MDVAPRRLLDPVDALTRLGGVVHRQDLLRVCGRGAVDRAVREGRLQQPHRSWLKLADQADDLYAARVARGVVGGLSAALHHNWAVKTPPREPEVIVPRNRGRLTAGQRRRAWEPGEVHGGILTPAATVVDCALAHPFDAALAVADSALRSRRVTARDVAAAALPLRPHQRRRVARVIEEATALAANPFESVTRAIALGVPGLHVVPQGQVDDIGHGDLVDHRLRLVIECESHEFHSLPEAFRYDVRRYTRMAVADWLVVRVVWEDVMHKPEQVRATLVDAVALAATRSRARGYPTGGTAA